MIYLFLLILVSYVLKVICYYQCNINGNSFRYTEELDFRRKRRTIQTNGCPNHFSVCQEESCGGANATFALVGDVLLNVPLFPRLALQSTVVEGHGDLVGVALNGVSIYGEYGTYTSYIDKCGGSADANGVYNYQLLPTCLLYQLGFNSTRHSPQIGWALDGFPIYGPIGFKGQPMFPCGFPGAHPVVCLDECNGFFGELKNIDEYLYRYYMPGSIGSGECSNNGGACPRQDTPCCLYPRPASAGAALPMTLSCLKGCPVNTPTCSNSNTLGYTAYYYPTLSAYPNGTYYSNTSGGGSSTSSPVFAANPTINSTANSSGAPSPVPLASSISQTVLVKFPFNGSLALMSPDSPTLTELLPTSQRDAYIRSISIDAVNSLLYFSTQYGVFYIPESGGDVVCVMSGYVRIRLRGYNLGNSVDDILRITVGTSDPQPCINIELISENEVHCVLILRYNRYEANAQSNNDYHSIISSMAGRLVFETISGSASAPVIEYSDEGEQNLTLFPFSAADVLSGSGRPVLVYVVGGGVGHAASSGYEAAFSPYALSISSSSTGRLYVSNIADETIFRLDLDQYRNVAAFYSIKTAMKKVLSIALLPVSVINATSSSTFSEEAVVYADVGRGVIAYTVPSTPSAVNNSYSLERVENIILANVNHLKGVVYEGRESSGKLLLFALIENGTILQINLDDYHTSLPAVASITSAGPKPSWLTSFSAYGASTRSRYTGLVLTPSHGYQASLTPYSANRDIERVRRRLLLSDSNSGTVATSQRSQLCSSLSEPVLCSSSRGNVLVDSNHDGVVWPTAITARALSSGGASNYSAVYIAEFLGKIWRIDVASPADQVLSPFSTKSSDIMRSDDASLVLDLSEFSASLQLRSLMSSRAAAVTVDAYGAETTQSVDMTRNAIFFEISDL